MDPIKVIFYLWTGSLLYAIAAAVTDVELLIPAILR